MTLAKLLCTYCRKVLYRTKGRITEAEKFGWKPYCSLACQCKQRNTQKRYMCSRPNCGKTFLRAPGDITNSPAYCSRSCAVIVNNAKVPKRKAFISECDECHKTFKGRRQYCSRACKYKGQIISGEEVCESIRDFYNQHERIPLKRELLHYGAARDRFGTWNAAIAAAGFKPNPILFSEKHIAKDGHSCDSLAEKIIDDWLVSKSVEHKRNIPYPEGKRLTVDFVIGNHWIEFFGLAGEIKNYDRLLRKKRRVCKKYAIPLLEIYPKDLFPKNRLAEVFKI